ncbi:MAG: hypothetical protein MJ249_02640 [Kiritimatiellae bacterium]|nr:hypothetical protein [Kiritimatiellia bacterium]
MKNNNLRLFSFSESDRDFFAKITSEIVGYFLYLDVGSSSLNHDVIGSLQGLCQAKIDELSEAINQNGLLIANEMSERGVHFFHTSFSFGAECINDGPLRRLKSSVVDGMYEGHEELTDGDDNKKDKFRYTLSLYEELVECINTSPVVEKNKYTGGDIVHVTIFVPPNVPGEKQADSCVIFSKKELLCDDIELIWLFFLKRMDQIKNKAIQFMACKIAIGSIMSRNGSHNIGSHVLSALSYNVGTMPDDRILYQYIQHRMDYVASATTEFPSWSVATPFVANVMRTFYLQRHLLDHIAGGEGLQAYKYQGHESDANVAQTGCIKIVVRKICDGERHDSGWSPVRIGTEMRSVREFFVEKNDVKEDVSLAIPGGVLGQHAFYNIVENITRNAAKHSWMGNSGKTGNLEIYVDFKEDADVVQFTVGDGVTKLFVQPIWEGFFKSAKRYLSDDDVVSYWHEFALESGRDAKECMNEARTALLGGQKQSECKECGLEHLKLTFAHELAREGDDSGVRALGDFLDDKRGVRLEELPACYRVLYAYLLHEWEKLKEDSSVLESLCGVRPNDVGKLGNRLPLPLHHRQELELAKPFIDLESRRLRQSSWGLAEMKISAGYLRRVSVSVVGGLCRMEKKERPLIVPIGIPTSVLVRSTNGGGVDPQNLHLAYRFWINKPQKMFIVVDDEKETYWNCVRGEGVAVAKHSTVIDQPRLMADYALVLVDMNDPKTMDRNLLPIRAVFLVDGTGSEKEQPDEPQIMRDEIKSLMDRGDKCDIRKKLISKACASWLAFLGRCRGEERRNGGYTVKLNTYLVSGQGKGLVSDQDVYRVLFCECFHSVVTSLIDDPTLKDEERMGMFLISLCPIKRSNDDLFCDISEEVAEGHEYKLGELVRKIVERVLSLVLEAQRGASGDQGESDERVLARAYVGCVERALKDFTFRFPNFIVNHDVHSMFSSSQDAFVNGVLQVLKKMAEQSEDELVGRIVVSLNSARITSDVFLRKYEERIVTLPQGHEGSDPTVANVVDFPGIGVKIARSYFSSEPFDVSYNRHGIDDARLYSEPISGTQSYFNTLANVNGTDELFAMRLVENGLIRILIIDERVCNFVRHQNVIVKKTYESMHIAVVNTYENPIENAKLKPERLKFVAHNERDQCYDLLIIHQGLIDKWWPQHSKEAVGRVLSGLRQLKSVVRKETRTFVRFVVITTGRGRPDNIPNNEKVLPFSLIEASLFRRYPEKLTLLNSVMNILPYERSNENG